MAKLINLLINKYCKYESSISWDHARCELGNRTSRYSETAVFVFISEYGESKPDWPVKFQILFGTDAHWLIKLWLAFKAKTWSNRFNASQARYQRDPNLSNRQLI